MIARAKSFTQQARLRNRRFVQEYLSRHPCVDCGEADVVVLQFDHVRGVKSREISRAVSAGWSLQSLKNEIAKCEVRCANCHIRVTAKRRQAGLVQHEEELEPLPLFD